MRSLVICIGLGVLLGAGAVTLAAAAGRPGPVPEEQSLVSAERRDHFVEAEDGRRLAQIDVVLYRTTTGPARLRVDIRADGPAVQPEPGYRGVPGHNLQTAAELTELVRRGRIRARVTGEHSGQNVALTVDTGPLRRLPVRCMTGDGRLDLDSLTPDAFVTSIACRSGDLPLEPLRFELLVDGVVRLVGGVDPTRTALHRFHAVGGLHRSTEGWR